MGSTYKSFLFLNCLIALISLLAFNLSCNRSNDGLGGDWNPDDLGDIEISRLSFTEPIGVHHLNSAIIKNQTDLDNYVLGIEQRDDRDDREAFLANVAEWDINFSSHNLLIYQHTEGCGDTQFDVKEPQIDGSDITVPIHLIREGMLTLVGYYCYVYKVGKPVTSVTFVVGLRNDVCFNISEEEVIVLEEKDIEVCDAYCTDTDLFHFTLTNGESESLEVEYAWTLDYPWDSEEVACEGSGTVLLSAMSEEEITVDIVDNMGDNYDARFYRMDIYIYHEEELVIYYFGRKDPYYYDYSMLPPVWMEKRDRPSTGEFISEGILFHLSTDKRFYEPGEDVLITTYIENQSTEDYEYYNSNLVTPLYVMVVSESELGVAINKGGDWKDFSLFGVSIPAITNITIESGDRLSFEITWDQMLFYHSEKWSDGGSSELRIAEPGWMYTVIAILESTASVDMNIWIESDS